MGIEVHDFSGNLPLESHHDGDGKNHHDHSQHNADKGNSQARRTFLPLIVQRHAPRNIEFVIHRRKGTKKTCTLRVLIYLCGLKNNYSIV